MASNQWTIAQRTQAVTTSDGDYDLGTDVIDVLSMVVRRSSTDFSMTRISRDEYLSIPNKTTKGQTNPVFYRQAGNAADKDLACA